LQKLLCFSADDDEEQQVARNEEDEDVDSSCSTTPSHGTKLILRHPLNTRSDA